jgi:non-ribosomal peptide synthase protein (TIGR01720 family)
MMSALGVSGMVVGGRLKMEWTYSEKEHGRERMAELANHYMEALEELMAHCRSGGAGGYTPSDFPEVSLTADELNNIIESLNQVAE